MSSLGITPDSGASLGEEMKVLRFIISNVKFPISLKVNLEVIAKFIIGGNEICIHTQRHTLLLIT